MDFITSEFFFIISIIILLILSFVVFLYIKLDSKIKKILAGNSVRNLEDLLIKINTDLELQNNFRKMAEKHFQDFDNRISTSIRGFETVNFNAFSGIDSGGNSFATAIVNEKGDGLIISSLKSRDHLNVFTKNICAGKCNLELSFEEEEALTKALKSCNLKNTL